MCIRDRINKHLPKLKDHGSTQMKAENQLKLDYLESKGIKRIVLPREMRKDEIKKLKIIFKAESNGSLDAVEKALKDIEEELIKIDLILKSVGAVTDSDILLASASDAIVIGFGVVPTSQAR